MGSDSATGGLRGGSASTACALSMRLCTAHYLITSAHDERRRTRSLVDPTWCASVVARTRREACAVHVVSVRRRSTQRVLRAHEVVVQVPRAVHEARGAVRPKVLTAHASCVHAMSHTKAQEAWMRLRGFEPLHNTPKWVKCVGLAQDGRWCRRKAVWVQDSCGFCTVHAQAHKKSSVYP